MLMGEKVSTSVWGQPAYVWYPQARRVPDLVRKKVLVMEAVVEEYVHKKISDLAQVRVMESEFMKGVFGTS
jgi:hypothetical protein